MIIIENHSSVSLFRIYIWNIFMLLFYPHQSTCTGNLEYEQVRMTYSKRKHRLLIILWKQIFFMFRKLYITYTAHTALMGKQKKIADESDSSSCTIAVLSYFFFTKLVHTFRTSPCLTPKHTTLHHNRTIRYVTNNKKLIRWQWWRWLAFKEWVIIVGGLRSRNINLINVHTMWWYLKKRLRRRQLLLLVLLLEQ